LWLQPGLSSRIGVEYYPFMSRETAVNVLIGTMLLLILGAGFAVCAEAFGIALFAADLAVRHYFPAVAHAWRIELLGLISLLILIGCANQVRKRLWTNAFLSLIAVVTIILPKLLTANQHPGLDGTPSRFPLAWFIFLILPQTTRTSRNEFIGCASIIVAAFAINSGLLSSGPLETVVEIGLYVAILGWILVGARDGKFGEPWGIFSASRT
jgi:hypothetical protein